jgi:hypothetical protein
MEGLCTAMIRISFPDSAPRDAAVFAQRLFQDLRRAGATESDVVIVKESDEAMDSGSILLIGDALHQVSNLVQASLALAAGAKEPALVAFQWAEHMHTAHWLLAAMLPKLFDFSHKFKTRIRFDTARGSFDLDAQSATLEDTKAKIEELTKDGGAGNN